MLDVHVEVMVISEGSWPNRIVRDPLATRYVLLVSVMVTVARRVTASCHPASRSRVVDRAQPSICSWLMFFLNPRTAPAIKMAASARTMRISMPVYPSSRRPPGGVVVRNECVPIAQPIPPGCAAKVLLPPLVLHPVWCMHNLKEFQTWT